jgi:aspartate aminotransferase, mitochondrial
LRFLIGLTDAFKADTHPQKINLGVGAYRTNDGKPIVLPSVRTAEQRILDRNTDKEYAPISGVGTFVDRSLEFAYGVDSEAVRSGRIAAVQAISGTGACRLAGEFLRKFVGTKPIYIPSPTWGNHPAIFESAGLSPAYYPYYDNLKQQVDFPKLIDFVKNVDMGSIFLLHACAHNPTGCDLSMIQWEELSVVMKQKQHICVFDSAYQGFASGNPEADAHAIRLFVAEGHQIFLCQSYAKVSCCGDLTSPVYVFICVCLCVCVWDAIRTLVCTENVPGCCLLSRSRRKKPSE